MPRTTINIDGPVLRDVKRLQKREGKPLGRLISELLAQALGQHPRAGTPEGPFVWTAHPMRARVNLADKDAVQAALDRDHGLRR